MKKIVLGLGAIALALSLSACEDLKMAQNAIKQEKSGESSGDSSDSGNNPLDALKKNLSTDSGESDDELTQYNNYVDFSNFLTGNFEDNIGRYFEGVKLLCFYNFSVNTEVAYVSEVEDYVNMLTGKKMKARDLIIPSHDFVWLKTGF